MNKEAYLRSREGQLQYNRLIAAAETTNTLKGEHTWPQQESNYIKYEQTLGLKPYTLRNSVLHFSSFKKNPLVLDVGSDTACIASLDAAGTAIGLADTRNGYQKKLDEENGRFFIAGDVLDYKTWIHAREVYGKYKMIVSVPEGGLKKITDNPLTHYHLLNEMWRSLDENNGELYVQTHMKTDRYVLTSIPLLHYTGWSNFLRTQNVQVEELERGLKFVKNSDSPKILPIPNLQQTVYSEVY